MSINKKARYHIFADRGEEKSTHLLFFNAIESVFSPRFCQAICA